ncbi:DUF2934 domain-containing protein [Rhizobium sp.]|uniref:DUF2934 domain-containing protein n=1 Tax=Rhizobium sp. TaxID=391 RepID=UPI00289F2F01
MQNEREEWIARRAYELWEQSGQPSGQEHEHWSQASGEWDEGKAEAPKPAGAWDEDE